MGYKISSFASISQNDMHSYFIYFILGREYRNESCAIVNDFIKNSFDEIAESIGPKGVIVVPHGNRTEKYISEVSGLELNGCIFAYQSGFQRDEMERHFHNGQPYLIVTKQPIVANDDKLEGVVINMDTVPDSRVIGDLFHLLIESIKMDSMDFFIENFQHWDSSYEPDKIGKYTQMLELKPNLFGIGFGESYFPHK